MIRKYSILIGTIISIIYLVISAWHYPGGSQYDKNSIGYDWKNNYISNLFSEKAINGADNASRPWAIFGMGFLCVSFALFFIEFSNKISSKGAAKVIRYFGVVAMLFTFLAVTPFHDKVITISSTLTLICMFYITVFVFKSKMHLFKILCAVCLLVAYSCNFVYYTGIYLQVLPILQKTALVIVIIWILSLQYFTTLSDFQAGKNGAFK